VNQRRRHARVTARANRAPALLFTAELSRRRRRFCVTHQLPERSVNFHSRFRCERGRPPSPLPTPPSPSSPASSFVIEFPFLFAFSLLLSYSLLFSMQRRLDVSLFPSFSVIFFRSWSRGRMRARRRMKIVTRMSSAQYGKRLYSSAKSLLGNEDRCISSRLIVFQ